MQTQLRSLLNGVLLIRLVHDIDEYSLGLIYKQGKLLLNHGQSWNDQRKLIRRGPEPSSVHQNHQAFYSDSDQLYAVSI